MRTSSSKPKPNPSTLLNPPDEAVNSVSISGKVINELRLLLDPKKGVLIYRGY
jgi:hypothetical protein